jgi:addiction module HigA family antidote
VLWVRGQRFKRATRPHRPLKVTRMHNPPHPGEVLREYLGNISVTEAAVRLGVNRVTISRVVTGSSGISADMAYRLGGAFGTSPEMWAGMQLQYDLHQASKLRRPLG